MTELNDKLENLMVEVDQLLRDRLKEIGIRGLHVVFLVPEPDDQPSRIRSNVSPEGLVEIAAEMVDIATQADSMKPQRPN